MRVLKKLFNKKTLNPGKKYVNKFSFTIFAHFHLKNALIKIPCY